MHPTATQWLSNSWLGSGGRAKGEIALAEVGTVIDREAAVSLKDVPPAALEAIRKGASGGKIKYVAKGEIHAELKGGQIIRLSSPRYVYEAGLQRDSQVAEIEVTSESQIIEAPRGNGGVQHKTDLTLGLRDGLVVMDRRMLIFQENRLAGQARVLIASSCEDCPLWGATI